MLATLAGLVALQPAAIPVGLSKVDLVVGPQTLEVFTYKPREYRDGPLIVVFHGVLRNASVYRDHAVGMGDRFKALIVAPKFDDRRFPTIKYQYGGMRYANGTPAHVWERTYALIPKLVERVRVMEGRADMPYYLIGHSAGGQFLVRMCAFMQGGATRVVAANPGSQLFPTRDRPFPYGYGGLPEELSSDLRMRWYLAQPLTLYLGTEDTKPDPNFDDSPEAMKQGAGRYQRNMASYEFARALAAARGWEFNWRVVTAPGIAHDHEKMFNAPQVEEALFGR